MRRFALLIILSLFVMHCAGSKKAAQERDAERARKQANDAFQELKDETQK